MHTREKLWTKSYVMALVVMFGLYLVAATLLSLMTVYAKKLTGVETYAGMMTAFFTLGSLSVRFLAGGLVDRYGGRKVILAGIGFMIAGSTVLLNCQDIVEVLLGRGFQGIGFGLSVTATGTFIAKMCHPSKLLEGISYAAVAQSLTSVIGPSLGFWIVGVQYERFQMLFIAALAVSFVTFFIMFFEKGSRGEQNGVVSNSEKNQSVVWPLLIIPVLILLTNALTQSAIVSFLALYAISLNIVGVGTFFSVNALGMISSRFFMRRLVERYGEFQMILANTIVFAASVFLLAQVHSFFQMLLLAFPAGFAMGSVAPIINTYLIQTIPDHKKGMANALYFSTLDIGFGVGSIGWGVIAASIGYAQVFSVAALIQVAGVILTLIHLRANVRSEKKRITVFNEGSI